MAASVPATAPAAATAAGALKSSTTTTRSSSFRSSEALVGTPLVASRQQPLSSTTSAGIMASSKPRSDSNGSSSKRGPQHVRAEGGDGGSGVSSSLVESIGELLTSFLKGGPAKSEPASDNETTDRVAAPVVEISGTVVLAKKNILDVRSAGADLLDTLTEAIGRTVDIRLVSVDLDPVSKEPKVSEASPIQDFQSEHNKIATGEDQYAITFTVPADFGEPGAILVTNNHPNEFYLTSLSLTLPGSSSNATVIHFPANSVIYNADTFNSRDRVFFSNKTYLPSRTPPGLLRLRAAELASKRGDGTGARQVGDRIYDYALYNDLSDPDSDPATARPVLGGSAARPYPRRIRTGRPPSAAAPELESNVGLLQSFYIPRDEVFSREKTSAFLADALKAALHSIVPAIDTLFDSTPDDFDSFADVKDLYDKGVDLAGCLPEEPVEEEAKASVLENPFVFLDQFLNPDGENKSLIKYPLPDVIQSSEVEWCSDEEFGRQALAGINPLMIELVREYPPTSSLDTAVYGPATALTDDHILPHLEGLTVAEAIKAKRLFKIDLHDLLLPFIELQNTQGNGQGYAPRSILFRTKDGTLKVIAIELALPPYNGNPASVRVLTAPLNQAAKTGTTTASKEEDDLANKDWAWEFAKIHANTVDFGVHELISHWLETHATMEPIIIASNRQLSAMHPVFVLLQPTFKNTMTINSAARQALINAGGIIERAFTPGKFSMELSSAVYGARWRFDRLALPEDLVARGMAEPGPNGAGVNLVIDDYPFAKDGLQLWDAIHKWTADYITLAYPDDAAVRADAELQAWWTEIVEVGHGDLAGAGWWPKLDSRASLARALATIAWTAGPHHAAVNFGQFAYAGYPPNRPSQTRRLVPEAGTTERAALEADPQAFVLGSISKKSNALSVMTTIEILSTHATDEEYVGKRASEIWTSDPAVRAAYDEFGRAIEKLEKDIVERNRDPALKNRRGPVQMPYMLLYPSSTDGMTGQGVPYSTSI